MRSGTRIGIVLSGAAWLLLGAVMVSFSRSPDAAEACRPDALWTGGWFFVPPLLALAGVGLTLRRSPGRAVGLGGNLLLIVLWTGVALPLWAFAAIAHGASCGGG